MKVVLRERETESNVEYEVEDIWSYDKSIDKYLVEWRGYAVPTWEPIENLNNCMEVVNKRRKKQGLRPILFANQELCGATSSPKAGLNTSNWVTLETIKQKLIQILTERHPKASINIQIGLPEQQPNSDTVYLISKFNHCVGIFFRSEEKCGYIFDSENVWRDREILGEEIERLKGTIELRPIEYRYRARNDFCGSQIVAAAIEIIGWHLRNIIPTEIKPSSVVRKRVEKAFHKKESQRGKKIKLSEVARNRRTKCPFCIKLIPRRGAHQHVSTRNQQELASVILKGSEKPSMYVQNKERNRDTSSEDPPGNCFQNAASLEVVSCERDEYPMKNNH